MADNSDSDCQEYCSRSRALGVVNDMRRS